MDRNMVYAAVSVVLAGLLGFSWAKGGGALNADEPKLAAQDIAVVDLAKVFDAHKGLTAKRDDLKRDAQRAEESLKSLVEAAKKLQEDLNRHKPGSAEHTRIQKELAEKGAEFQKRRGEQLQELQQKEAAVYHNTYKQIMEEIQRIAEARGIRLVIRTETLAPDTKDQKKLIETMNRQVLYQNGLDITDEVVQAVN
jgi:Skp family chaperone for outer membrane proteins